MRLTLFGNAVRRLRMDFGLSLKAMADSIGISSAHLSAIEYGEKTLSEKHIAAALGFFSPIATPVQLRELRDAAEKSIQAVNTTSLSSDARGFVAAFARKLQEGRTPTKEMMNFLNSQH